MAGTLTDQATLATDNAFINKCRAAMLARSVELIKSATPQNFATLGKVMHVFQNAAGDAPSMAWRVATGSAAIAAAAPVVPSDSDTQQAVNVILALL